MHFRFGERWDGRFRLGFLNQLILLGCFCDFGRFGFGGSFGGSSGYILIFKNGLYGAGAC
jgi:hypothetical protein